VQEVSASSPVLRDAAQECFVKAQAYFQSLLDDAVQSDACRASKRKLNTASLAEHWMGTVQGSLLLAKASRDEQVIRRNLTHFRNYMSALLQTQT
jgi:hypothetical protein